MPHRFHIPVMGTCFTTDTPLRVSHLGIDSAISLVDDRLLEQIGNFYAQKFDIPYEKIPFGIPHTRAKRIRNYLNLVCAICRENFRRVLESPIDGHSEKDRYFQLLPSDDPLRKRYTQMISLPPGELRTNEENFLTRQMKPGAVDANIMVKLDRPGFDDAKEALRGYAESELCQNTSLILSAGINQSLFSEMEKFPCFYRNKSGDFDKKITIKISDFRSAQIQGKFLSRKGLEVSEYRIESGLNCGGHLFPADGELLPSILRDFLEKREVLCNGFSAAVEKYYTAHGLDLNRLKVPHRPRFTVQGGIGNSGEMERLLKVYAMDGCGWGSPFLLVPEATLVDEKTRSLLVQATDKEIYASHSSPLGVPFSNLKTCGAEIDRLRKISMGTPGSSCPKGFLQSDTEFSEKPICTASREYQKAKIAQIDKQDLSAEKKSLLKSRVLEKTCICHELGNSALIALGISNEKDSPPSICPGPNLAYFNRKFSLDEMVDFIYGRTQNLAEKDRPHMFAEEISLYAKWFFEEEKLAENEEGRRRLQTIAQNLNAGIKLALDAAESPSFPGENLESIREAAAKARRQIRRYLEDSPINP